MTTEMRIRNALLALGILIWGYFAYLGIEGILRISAQHVPGSPTRNQVIYYFAVPATVTVVSIFALQFRWQRPYARNDILVSGWPILLFPLYLLFFRGGL